MNLRMYCPTCKQSIIPISELVHDGPGYEREYQDYCPVCESTDLAPYECSICNAEGEPLHYPIVEHGDDLICLGCYIREKEKERNFKFSTNMIKSSARHVFHVQEDCIDTAIEIMRENESE